MRILLYHEVVNGQSQEIHAVSARHFAMQMQGCLRPGTI